MDADPYLRKLHFRAHHRGTREADALVGGFFDHRSAGWTQADFAWFERLLEEQDVDIIGWALGTHDVDPAFEGSMMDDLKRLDFVNLPIGIRN
jgi:antitoxin CptB